MKNNDLIILCAFRYALGRMSYIVGVVCDYIKDNIDIIDNKAITIMLREISEAKDNDSLGMDCDQREWLELFGFLKDEENRRLNGVFDLTKKEDYIKELQDEVDKYKHEYYSMCDLFENPQAYEFDDLKVGMWIWDNFECECVKIIDKYIVQKANSIYTLGTKIIEIKNINIRDRIAFEKNRFYPVQMANSYGRCSVLVN